MLPEEQRLEILAEMARYPDPRATSVEALKVVQRSDRWVSDEALADTAELLGMSVDELDNVATFYNLIFRRPVGDHVILVCNSISCWIVRYAELRAALERYLGIGFGQTTPDGRFTLLPIVCLGACDRAPAMMVDEDLYGPVEAKDLDEILSGYPRRTEK
jgi:NADH-quinone oxidoreductase subunit E